MSALVLDGASAFPRVLAPFVPLLGWCVRFPRVLTPLAPIVEPLHGWCPESLDSHRRTFSWMVRPPSQGSWLSLHAFLHIMSALPKVLPPFVPLLGWCVRFPEGLVSLSPIVPLYSLGWMACPPSWGSCLPLSPIVPLLVSFLLATLKYYRVLLDTQI